MLLPIKDCGKGVNKDALPTELAPGMWSDGLNVEFGDGFARQRKGVQVVYTTPTAVPYFMMTATLGATRYLIQAGTATIFADDGSTRTDLTPASAPTGGRDDRWTGGVLNGVPFLNNGVDDPLYWDGDVANNFAALSGWTAGDTVSAMRAFGYYLVGLGYTPTGGALKPYRVKWSNAAEPGSLPTAWTASSTNDAGEVDITEAGVLVDCLPLGNVNIIYGKEGRYAMRYIGGNEVYAFDPLPGKDGLFNKGCVVNTPKGHVFMSNGDVMIHTGGMATSIAQGSYRNWIFSTMDSANASRAFLTLNPQRSEVWVVFPSTGQTDCDKIAAWNWNTGVWTTHEISGLTCGTSGLVSSSLSGGTNDSDTATIDSDTATNDQDEYSANEARLILATSTPQIGLANVGSTDFGSTFDWYLERTGIRPSEADQMLILRGSRWAFDGASGATASIYHGAAKTADADPSYVTASTHTQGTTNWVTKFANRGRYLAVKVSGTSGQQLALRSFELDIRPGGQF